MSKILRTLLTRYMNAADGEGNDLPGDNHLDDDAYKPGSPEDRGDFLATDEPGAAASTEAAPAPAAQAPAAAPAPAEAATQEEAADAADDGSEGRNSGSVPHSRFNEVNQRRKEAERLLEQERAENARLRSEKAAAATATGVAKDGTGGTTQAADDQAFDFDAKESAYLDALMEGETEKAKQIRREVNAALVEQARSNAKAEARAELEHAEAQRSQKAAMTALADEADVVVKAYPYLDTEAGEAAMEMIIERRNSLAAKGMAPHLALREAAALIAPRFNPAGNTPAKDLKAGAPQADSREAAARTRGAQASVAQPPAPVAGMGNRATGNDTTDVARMDDDQFDRLSEADKRRLRGD